MLRVFQGSAIHQNDSRPCMESLARLLPTLRGENQTETVMQNIELNDHADQEWLRNPPSAIDGWSVAIIALYAFLAGFGFALMITAYAL